MQNTAQGRGGEDGAGKFVIHTQLKNILITMKTYKPT